MNAGLEFCVHSILILLYAGINMKRLNEGHLSFSSSFGEFINRESFLDKDPFLSLRTLTPLAPGHLLTEEERRRKAICETPLSRTTSDLHAFVQFYLTFFCTDHRTHKFVIMVDLDSTSPQNCSVTPVHSPFIHRAKNVVRTL